MKRMTTKEIALWKRANAQGSLTARTADDLLALRAEVRRLRNALLNIQSQAHYGTQIKGWADDALRPRAKPKGAKR